MKAIALRFLSLFRPATLTQGSSTMPPVLPPKPVLHAKWLLRAYNAKGEVIGQIVKPIDGAAILHGDWTDLAFAAADIRKIPAFFTDPEAIGKKAYQAYTASLKESGVRFANAQGEYPAWEQTLPVSRQAFIAAARAIVMSDPTVN